MNGDITFDDACGNVGQGMNFSSGYFTAPTSGLYYFSFSATAYDENQYNFVNIAVWKTSNGHSFILETISDSNSVKGDLMRYQHRNLAATWMAVLEKGDTVNLNVQTGYLAADMGITFTGQLLLLPQ